MVIFSLDTVTRPATDAERLAVIQDLNATPVLGVYKGELESSFMVEDKYLTDVLFLAYKYKQECILQYDDSGVYLIYPSSGSGTLQATKQRIGDYMSLESKKPDVDAYTIVNNGFMVAKKRGE